MEQLIINHVNCDEALVNGLSRFKNVCDLSLFWLRKEWGIPDISDAIWRRLQPLHLFELRYSLAGDDSITKKLLKKLTNSHQSLQICDIQSQKAHINSESVNAIANFVHLEQID